MAYVGMVYNPQPRAADEEALSEPCDGARYLAGLYILDALGLQLRRQGGPVGMNAADCWVGAGCGQVRALSSKSSNRTWEAEPAR